MTILVSNLSKTVTEQDLNNLFAQFGSVKATRITINLLRHRLPCSGIVIMNDSVEGAEAVFKLNNTSFMQQAILVAEAGLRNNTSVTNHRYQ